MVWVVNIEGWAPFSGSVEASGASGTILYITIKVSPKKICRLQCFFPELIESSYSSHRFLTLLFPLTRQCSFGSSWAADISITRVIYIHVPIFNMIYNYFCNCNFLEIQVFAVIQFLYLVRWLAYILASYGIMLIIRQLIAEYSPCYSFPASLKWFANL